MAKHIAKGQKGGLIDKAAGGKEWRGRLTKDLDVGDVYEDDEKKMFKVTDKEVTPEGFLVVRSVEV